jgi:hypothetical protein
MSRGMITLAVEPAMVEVAEGLEVAEKVLQIVALAEVKATPGLQVMSAQGA